MCRSAGGFSVAGFKVSGSLRPSKERQESPLCAKAKGAEACGIVERLQHPMTLVYHRYIVLNFSVLSDPARSR